MWKRLTFILTSLSLLGGPLLALDPDNLGPYGGDVRSLAVHPERPDTFFLGTADGQIFVSHDTGESWTRLSPGLNRRNLVVDELVFHPHDPNVLYAATWSLKGDAGWLFRTEDGGKSWTHLPLGRYTSSIRALAVSPADPNVIAAGITEGVVLSTDGGKTWDRINRGYRSLHNVHSLAFDAHDSNALYVGTFRLAWKTYDHGRNWQPIHSGMYWDSDLFAMVVHPRDSETIFSAACSGIYRSRNRGEVWTRLREGIPPGAHRTRTIRIDPSEPERVYAGTTVGVFVSNDGGDSWEELYGGVVINTIAIHPADSRILLLGTDDAGVLKSTDRGATFRPTNSGFVNRQISALAASPGMPEQVYAAVAKDREFGGFFMTRDGGGRWSRFNDGLPPSLYSDIQVILPSSGSPQVLLGTSEGVFEGIPGHTPWSRIEPTRDLRILDMSFFGDGGRILLATSKGLYRLGVGREELVPIPIEDHEGPVTSVLFDSNTGLLYAGTPAGVFRSRDRGESWSRAARGLPESFVNGLEEVDGLLLAATRRGLHLSEAGGDSWRPAQGVFPIDIVSVRAHPSGNGTVFAADLQVGYLFRSVDGGRTWEVLVHGHTNSRILQLAFSSDGELLVGTTSDGIYRLEVPTQIAEGK